MKFLLVCTLLSCLSSCLAKAVDSEVLYPPSLAAIGSNGLNYKPYYFWRPRSLHGYPLSPFPADDVTGGLEGGVDDDEDNIRVSVRSSPDLAPISNAGGQRSDDSWSFNRKRNDELSRLAMRMLKRGHAIPFKNGQYE